jgi:hypothetical protein
VFEAPLTFAEAEAMLTARLDTPTALRHKEIAALWDDEFRSRAFFSARVTEATVLSELHRRAQDVLDGKMTGKQAVELLRDYFVGPGADALAAMGFAPKRDARTIGELASLPRLQLIIETNVRMAQECGHYQQWAESAVYWRYGIWRCGYAEEHREEHLARDGRAYAFEHPIWTQSPPGGEFNCHCWREIASEDDIRELGIEPEPLSSPFQPSSLGFDPSRGMAEPPPFGKRVRPEYREKAQEKINEHLAKGDVPTTPATPAPAPTPTPTVGPVAVPEEEDVRALPVKEAIEKKADLVKEMQDKTKMVVEENDRIEKAINSEAKRINDQIRALKKRAHSLQAAPDNVQGEIRKLQRERNKCYEQLEKNRRQLYLNISEALSIPEGDRIEMQITMPRKCAAKDRVTDAKTIIENLTSKKLGLSRDGVSVGSVASGVRSKYSSQENKIYIRSDAFAPVVAHEMAHWLEESSDHVHKRCVEFLDYRCAGETPEELSKLTGIKEYEPYEIARKDKFFNPYCGIDYLDGSGRRYATEILSMGIQRVLSYPLQFMREDPEYFAFVLLLLRGSL